MRALMVLAGLLLASCAAGPTAREIAETRCEDAAPADRTTCIQTERLLLAQERTYRLNAYSFATRGF